MPISVAILLGVVLAAVGAAVALSPRRRLVGLLIMLLGLTLAGGLSLLLALSLRTM